MKVDGFTTNKHVFAFWKRAPAHIRSQDQNGCAIFRKWSAFLAIGSLRLWRCDEASSGTRTSAWRSGSRCASRTHNAPTGKHTARLRKPRAVCLSSTLSYQPANEHAGGVLECLEIGSVVRSPEGLAPAMARKWAEPCRH